VGFEGTSRWLRAVAARTGRQSEAEAFIKLHEGTGSGVSLNDKKIYISGETIPALGLADLVHEAGGTVAGLSLSTIDQNTANTIEESYKKHGWKFPLHIGDGQLFEQLNIINRLKPDVYLGEWGQVVQVARSGIPALNFSALPLYGYDAAVRLVAKINRAWNGRAFVEKHRAFAAPYSESWLIKNPNWYIKQEVG
jgi:nitrogenase molybdenum-iron protein alpha/beta subunit